MKCFFLSLYWYHDTQNAIVTILYLQCCWLRDSISFIHFVRKFLFLTENVSRNIGNGSQSIVSNDIVPKLCFFVKYSFSVLMLHVWYICKGVCYVTVLPSMYRHSLFNSRSRTKPNAPMIDHSSNIVSWSQYTFTFDNKGRSLKHFYCLCVPLYGKSYILFAVDLLYVLFADQGLFLRKTAVYFYSCF